jgi:hypothetical protein
MADLNDPIRTPAPDRPSILKRRADGKASKPIMWWALGALAVLFILGAMFYDVQTPKQAGLSPPATTSGSAVQAPTNVPAGSGTQKP